MTDFAALLSALGEHRVEYLRGAPQGLPFAWNRPTLQRGLNFTLVTSLGDIDLLGEIPGGGRFEDLQGAAIELHFEAVAELEAIREERETA